MTPPRKTPPTVPTANPETAATPAFALDVNRDRQRNFEHLYAMTVATSKTSEWHQDQIALTLDHLTTDIVRRFGHDAVAEILLDRVHRGLLHGRDQYRVLRRLLGSSDYTAVALRFLVTPTMSVIEAEERAVVNELAAKAAHLANELDRKRGPHATLEPTELARMLKSLRSTLAELKRTQRRTEPKLPTLKRSRASRARSRS